MIENFGCIKCGQCCLTLPTYSGLASKEDLERWKNRSDILEWINEDMFWYDPKTGKHPETCPWIKDNKCSIHDIKPDRCKGYPANIELAILTKCNGKW